jgi:hypothetical protein
MVMVRIVPAANGLRTNPRTRRHAGRNSPLSVRTFPRWKSSTQAAALGLRDAAGSSTQLSYFQPTLEPTEHRVLHDFRVFWQSPRSCKLL